MPAIKRSEHLKRVATSVSLRRVCQKWKRQSKVSCLFVWVRVHPKHRLTLRWAAITSNWTGPTQTKQPTTITQGCAALGGGLKLLLYGQVCILNPQESHYSSTVLFTAPINNNSQSPRVLHCPNLHEVWGLRYMWVIEVRANVHSLTHATRGEWKT